MTRNAPKHEACAEQPLRPATRRPTLRAGSTATVAALVGLALIGAGCYGSHVPGVAGSASSTGGHTSASTASSSHVSAQAVAYAHCMRNHGVPDFPDPTLNPGGSVSFQIDGGAGSDLNHNNPRFKAAEQACLSLMPGGDQAPAPGTQKIAAEVKWAVCMRSHGLPGFPDPNAQGAFDSSRFDDSSPAFLRATRACQALEPAGPISAVPGHGSAS
jgi:hypothetical protein